MKVYVICPIDCSPIAVFSSKELALLYWSNENRDRLAAGRTTMHLLACDIEEYEVDKP